MLNQNNLRIVIVIAIYDNTNTEEIFGWHIF
jgi:hypothetical protein